VSVVVGITSPDDGSSSTDFTNKLSAVPASALSFSLKAALPTLASSLSPSSLAVTVGQLTNTPTPAPSPYSLPAEETASSATNLGVVGAAVGGFAVITIVIFRCFMLDPRPRIPPNDDEDEDVDEAVWVDSNEIQKYTQQQIADGQPRKSVEALRHLGALLCVARPYR